MIIGTHNGIFHSDEIIAVALFSATEKVTSIIRSRDIKVLAKADTLVDVGGKYDGQNFFDHHQLREGDDLYGLSSAGMVAKSISVSYTCNDCWNNGEIPLHVENRCCHSCGSEATILDSLYWKRDIISAVDARDTRVNWDKNGKFEPLFNAVNDCNNIDIGSKDQYAMFLALVQIFTSYFKGEIEYEELFAKVSEIGATNKTKKEKIMKDRFSKVVKVGMIGNIPMYKNKNLEYVDTSLFGDKPFIFISFDGTQNNYSVSTNTNYCKIVDINNKVFVHANGFFAKTNSIDNLNIEIEEV